MPPHKSLSNFVGYSSSIGTPLKPRLENSASYLSLLILRDTVILSMTVWLPFCLSRESIFCASSGRTKLSASIFFTLSTPCSIISGSSELQYCPRRNSNTYTGTFAPSFIFFVKSFRTIFPSKYLRNFCLMAVRLSSASISKGIVLYLIST